MIRFPLGLKLTMKQDIYRCKRCEHEESYPKGSEVWCPCRPRKKTKMEIIDKELQKIMKIEKKINLEVSKW